MKRLIFFTFLIVIILTTNLMGQWDVLNEGGSYRTIDFINDQVGWVAGAGTLLKTEDGGDTWNFVTMDSVWNIVKIDFVSETIGWAVGGNGLVLKTEDGINWVDQNSGKMYPNKFSLAQNYPNPFNPTTAIGYQLSAISDVELGIYNVLGQKILTLVNEKQKAGFHKVEWDALGFASGVYYYRIEAGEFQDVKKMILIR